MLKEQWSCVKHLALKKKHNLMASTWFVNGKMYEYLMSRHCLDWIFNFMYDDMFYCRTVASMIASAWLVTWRQDKSFCSGNVCIVKFAGWNLLSAVMLGRYYSGGFQQQQCRLLVRKAEAAAHYLVSWWWSRVKCLFMATLHSRCRHYIFVLFLLLSFFFSWPNPSGRRLDVYHTSTHGVALVRI